MSTDRTVIDRTTTEISNGEFGGATYDADYPQPIRDTSYRARATITR